MPIHLQIIHIHSLIPEPLSFLLPPENDYWEYYLHLLQHHNVKYWAHINVFMKAGDKLTNFIQPYVYKHIAMGGGGTTIVRSVTYSYGHKSSAPPDYESLPTPTGCGVLRTTTTIQISAQTEPLTHRPPQRSWCHPLITPIDRITGTIFSMLSGGSDPQRASHCCQRTALCPVNWRYCSEVYGSCSKNPRFHRFSRNW